jgi:eukaryotic-like serine/threonine-protein kinase
MAISPGDAKDSVATLLQNCPELNSYEFVDKIGEGGMGAVFLLRERETNENVAIKVMHEEPGMTEDDRTRFRREIRHAMAITHPHIVTARAIGDYNGVPYYLMEFCEGGNVASRGILSVAVAGDVILQVLDALEFVHTTQVVVEFVKGKPDELTGIAPRDLKPEEFKGLVHRDLKPANILLAKKGAYDAKIADLGFAKAFEAAGKTVVTTPGYAAGTPEFMPRQQLADFRHAKPEVDVWAAAASFYNMVTGAVPRDFIPTKNRFAQLPLLKPVPIRQRNSAIAAPIAQVIDRALDDSKGTPGTLFYQSAAELRDALKAVL